MPEKRTLAAAKRDLRRGDAPSTAAGEFVREEIHHIREGKHGARSTKQAIAIGLSKARRAGVPLGPAKTGSKRTKASSARDYATGQHRRKPRTHSAKRGRAVERALEREGHGAASHASLSKQARKASAKRTHAQRSAAARKAARTRAKHAR
jgi:hypothetical protein